MYVIRFDIHTVKQQEVVTYIHVTCSSVCDQDQDC